MTETELKENETEWNLLMDKIEEDNKKQMSQQLDLDEMDRLRAEVKKLRSLIYELRSDNKTLNSISFDRRCENERLKKALTWCVGCSLVTMAILIYELVTR